MAREDPQLKLRLTDEMKERVTDAARQSGRSVNAEIVWRLEQSFGNPMSTYNPDIAREFLDRLARQEEMLTKIMEDREEYMQYLKDFSGELDR